MFWQNDLYATLLLSDFQIHRNIKAIQLSQNHILAAPGDLHPHTHEIYETHTQSFIHQKMVETQNTTILNKEIKYNSSPTLTTLFTKQSTPLYRVLLSGDL